jgi:hypothetical protein
MPASAASATGTNIFWERQLISGHRKSPSWVYLRVSRIHSDAEIKVGNMWIMIGEPFVKEAPSAYNHLQWPHVLILSLHPWVRLLFQQENGDMKTWCVT